jgi:hypothetical protein
VSSSDPDLDGHWHRGREASRPRPGWYAYQINGPAELPSWASEVALAIERPSAHEPDGSANQLATAARPPEPEWSGEQLQAMVLLRAPGRAQWLSGVAEAIAAIEHVAGVRPASRVDAVGPHRLMPGPGLPGLVPVTAAGVLGVGAAGGRGLPAPLRRWRPAAGAMVWRPSAGAVVTCEGPSGVSAQAVVALRGLGNTLAITPPPGGALVLRAWRARRSWGVACGLVIGRDSGLGLGREAGRAAARARADGWHADVLTGSTALQLVRAGDPAAAAPEAAAYAASASEVAALFEAASSLESSTARPPGPGGR